jgi:hypothetical protein
MTGKKTNNETSKQMKTIISESAMKKTKQAIGQEKVMMVTFTRY